MKVFLIACLISAATSAIHKNEGLICDLKPGDRVLMTGRYTGINMAQGLVLAIRSPNEIHARIEIFPGRQKFYLRSKTLTQAQSSLFKEGPYNGGDNVRIEVTVKAGGGYQVSINNMDVGTIPRITGPRPTVVRTSQKIDTDLLQVFSNCANNPATTTLSPEVRDATTRLTTARNELKAAIKAKSLADATAAKAVEEFDKLMASTGAKRNQNQLALDAINTILAQVIIARTAGGNAVRDAETARTAAMNADVAARAASARALEDANGDMDNVALATARDQAAASAKKAADALAKATADLDSARAAQATVVTSAAAVTTSRDFLNAKIRASNTADDLLIADARNKATTAAGAVNTANANVAAKRIAVTAAEAALAGATAG